MSRLPLPSMSPDVNVDKTLTPTSKTYEKHPQQSTVKKRNERNKLHDFVTIFHSIDGIHKLN